MPTNQTAFIVKLEDSLSPEEALEMAADIEDELTNSGFDVVSVDPWKRGEQSAPTLIQNDTTILDVFPNPFKQEPPTEQ